MPDIRLLAVVEVPKSDRVICQSPGCKHSVYKRIHVVSQDGDITVFGSECFKKLFGEHDHHPTYGSGEGRLLTPEERLLLLQNTARLIEQFEAEHKAKLERSSPPIELKPAEKQKPQEAEGTAEAGVRLTRYEAELKVKQELRAQGVNPEAPGWHGYFQLKVNELLRK